MRFVAAHPPCGTRVVTELPAGYPVEEGVGLYCSACHAAWWEEPGAAAEPSVAAAAEPPVTAPEPPFTASEPPSSGGVVEVPVPLGATTSTTPRVVAPALAPPPSRPAVPAPAEPGRRWWPAALALGAFLVLAVVVAVSAIAPSASPPEADASPLATSTPAPTATATPAPPVTRTVTRQVADRRLTATLGEGWTVRRHRTGLTYAGPDGVQVRVSAGPRKGRDLRRLGRDARKALGAPRATPRRTTVGGRPAIVVRGRGQAIVQVADGRRRWLISRPADAGAPVVRSLRLRPAA